MELTEQQRDIITYEGNSCVLASAGSGKTESITKKISYIKDRDPNASILYITFTRKAKKHAIEKIGPVSKVMVTNYHGLAYACLSRMKAELQYKSIDIVPESYGKTILEGLYPDDDARTLQDKMSFIETVKEEQIELANLELQHFSLFTQFQKIMDSSKKMMYSDLIYKFNILFNENKLTAYIATQFLKFDYIFLDEFQDTNNSQFIFIKNIMSLNPGAKITAVGDISQSIYEWRGSRPDLTLTFINDYNAKVMPLTMNFRSQESIIDLGNNVLDMLTKYPELTFKMNYFKPRGENVALHISTSQDEQYYLVCQEIVRLINKGYKYSDITILFRANLTGRMFEKYAFRFGIPFKVLNSTLMGRKEVVAFINILKLCIENSKEDKSIKFINKYLESFAKGMVPTIASVLFDKLIDVDKEVSAIDTLANFESLKVSGFGAKRKESIAYLNVMLHKLLKGYSKYMTQTINMQEYFKECIEVILEFKDIKKENNAAFSVIEENLNSLTTILLEMEGDLEERINTFLIEYSGENVKDDRDHVLGLTIHKAKGCENKVCFILDFQDFPARFSENTEEETRVLYVAVTRAMEKLYITGVTLETPFFKIFEKFDYLATNLSKEILENAGKVYADRQG